MARDQLSTTHTHDTTLPAVQPSVSLLEDGWERGQMQRYIDMHTRMTEAEFRRTYLCEWWEDPHALQAREDKPSPT